MAESFSLKDHAEEFRVFRTRIVIISFFVVICFGVLVFRYFHLQIVRHDNYTTLSEANRIHARPVAPSRGEIVDRNGVVIASSHAGYILSVVRERVIDMEETLQILSSLMPITDVEIEKFRKNLQSRNHKPYETIPLRYQLTESEIAIIALNEYRLPGVEVQAQLVRNYPYGDLFAHTIGYVGRITQSDVDALTADNRLQDYEGLDSIGKLGLESVYESELRGTVGAENVETNARGQALRVLDRQDPLPGKTLTLTLDVNVQKRAQELLAGKRAGVVAIEIGTGAVVAAISTPAFDPNLFVTGIRSADYAALRDSPDYPLLNRMLQGLYPPASTIKPVLALAGLHYGVVTPETAVFDPGYFQLPGEERHYRDWKASGHGGAVRLYEAIEQSCDTYFYTLAYKLGVNRMHPFISQFGLGVPTGVDLTSEKAGVLPSAEWKQKRYKLPWYGGDSLNSGIGQGYNLVTPMQLAYMTSVIASRGQRIRPHLLKAVNGVDIQPEVLPPVKLSDEKYWDDVLEGMKAVTHGSHGTARRIAIGADYQMGGKTGTAQVIGIAQNEKYNASETAERHRDHALFIGFAPYDNPRIAVGVIVENGEHGGTSAAPVARALFDIYFKGSADAAILEISDEAGD